MSRHTYRLFLPEHEDFPDVTFTSKKQAIAMAKWLAKELITCKPIHWYRDDYFTPESFLRKTKNARSEDELRRGSSEGADQ